MTLQELKYKEAKLRECFMEKLEELDVDGKNDYSTVKCIKNYGVLWHLAHQLLMAEEKEGVSANSAGISNGSTTTADAMNIQATGLSMRK